MYSALSEIQVLILIYVLSILNSGVFKNLHVLLLKRIKDSEKIRSQELQNGIKTCK